MGEVPQLRHVLPVGFAGEEGGLDAELGRHAHRHHPEGIVRVGVEEEGARDLGAGARIGDLDRPGPTPVQRIDQDEVRPDGLAGLREVDGAGDGRHVGVQPQRLDPLVGHGQQDVGRVGVRARAKAEDAAARSGAHSKASGGKEVADGRDDTVLLIGAHAGEDRQATGPRSPRLRPPGSCPGRRPTARGRAGGAAARGNAGPSGSRPRRAPSAAGRVPPCGSRRGGRRGRRGRCGAARSAGRGRPPHSGPRAPGAHPSRLRCGRACG